MLNYRREIDGLRAIAVVPVIFFHASLPLFGGGFVGVDIFFVISGYLITSIIISDRDSGQFSVAQFYERRARRILPALFIVLASSAVFSWFLLVPGDMRDFTRGLRYVLIFYSNHYFYRNTGYFATEADLQPLLHTWSLAIEEQFYLIFPLILAVPFLRKSGALLTTLAVLLIASFAKSQLLISSDPAAAFFGITSRFWELLVGSTLAILLRMYPAPPGSANFLSTMGLALIAWAIFFFDKTTPFPGFSALAPTVGAALLIAYATPLTPVGRLLGTRFLVGLGLVSYSLYLWHQPLLVFARFGSGATVHPLVPVGAILLSVVLAYVTWRYVETPFRRKGVIGRSTLVGFSLSFLAGLFAFGFGGRITDGYAFRSPKTKELTERMQLDFGLGKECGTIDTFEPTCVKGKEPEILVWGDSYAAHLMAGLLEAAPDLGVIQMTKLGCGPILDAAPIGVMKGDGWLDGCITRNDLVFEKIRDYPSLKYVVVSSPFTTYFSDGAQVYLRDGTIHKGNEIAIDLFMKTLGKLRLMGVTPIVVLPPPRNAQDIGRCVSRAEFFSLDRRICNFDLASSTAASTGIRKMHGSLLSGGYKTFDLSDAICAGGICRPIIDDTMLYIDNGHLTREGSIFVFTKLGISDAFRHANDSK